MRAWTMPADSREVAVRSWLWIATVTMLCMIAAPRPCQASPTDPATVPELVAAVEGTYKSVNSIRAEFTQASKNPLTGIEESVKGRIALERPRKMRAEFGVPVKQAIVMDGAMQWLYSADQKQVIVQKDLGGSNPVSALIENLGQINELFDVTMAPSTNPAKQVHVVTLKPKQAGAIKTLELTVTKHKYLLQELVVIDQADSVTRMSFTLVRTNVDIPDVEFSFKAPPGVTVVNM